MRFHQKREYYVAIAINILALVFITGCGENPISSENIGGKAYIAFERSLSWSPDSAQIAYISNNAIVIRNILDNDVREFTGMGIYDYPVWSPDGKKLAFTSATREDSRAKIFVKSSDGSDVAKKLSTETASYFHPRWSPDGKKIAFHSYQKRNMNIFVRNADFTGGEVMIVSDPSIDQNAEWSPDGTKLVFESDRSGNFDIWIVDSNGVNPPVQVNSNPSKDTLPIWSNDGKRILFQSDRYGLIGVWVMNADGNGEAIHISQGFAKAEKADWSPDDKWVLFVSNNIAYARRSDGTGNPIKIAEALEAKWSPDGTKIALIGLEDYEYKVKVINVPNELK